MEAELQSDMDAISCILSCIADSCKLPENKKNEWHSQIMGYFDPNKADDCLYLIKCILGEITHPMGMAWFSYNRWCKSANKRQSSVKNVNEWLDYVRSEFAEQFAKVKNAKS